MRKVRTPSSAALPSKMSPVCRNKFGISIAASGSVHSATSRSPAFKLDSIRRTRSAGTGHFKPRRFRILSLMKSLYTQCCWGLRDPIRRRCSTSRARALRRPTELLAHELAILRRDVPYYEVEDRPDRRVRKLRFWSRWPKNTTPSHPVRLPRATGPFVRSL